MGRWYEALKNRGSAADAHPQNLQNPTERGSEGFEGQALPPSSSIEDAADRVMAYEERAAILEYCAGFSRDVAEFQAHIDVYGAAPRT